MLSKKVVSTMRKFKNIGDSKLEDLKKTKLKKCTEAKMLWAVRAYNDWRSVRLSNYQNFDVRILEADLNDVRNLERKSFEYAMCKFIAEVVKVKDGKDYPGATLYRMCVGIQKFLISKGKHWKLIKGGQFEGLHNVLDNVMKERATSSIGTTKCQADLLSIQEENKLWESGVLGEENPTQLRNTVLFLIGLNIGLRAGDEQYNLRRDREGLPSQLQFQRN